MEGFILCNKEKIYNKGGDILKKLLVFVITNVIAINFIGCCKTVDLNIKNFKNQISELKVYGKEESSEIIKILTSCGNNKDLSIDNAIKKNMIVIKNGKMVGNKNLWDNFNKNIKNKKEDSVIIVQYTAQEDAILIYLSYNKDKFFMIKDESRDRHREVRDKNYYEYDFKYMRIFEENNNIYAYLLDDNNITLDELNYSLISEDISQWVHYGFIFHINK